MLIRQRYFKPPAARAFRESGVEYRPGHATYTSYNYAGGGMAARVKAAHFEAALRVTREHHGRSGVIDFGCANGVFLPALARCFPRVHAVDIRPDMVAVAERVRDELQLDRVTLVCNSDRDFASLARDTRGGDYRVAFLLETLEHIGEPGRLYESKTEFLEQVLGLLEPGGIAVVSVPVMVGLPFLVQRLGLWALGLHREAIGRKDLANAVLRRNTDALEPAWTGNAHLGFNHLKLESRLRERFRIVDRRNLIFTQLYVVASR